MIKILTIAITLSLFSLLLFTFFNTDSETDRQWTKALCDGNVCQDYLISCSGIKIAKMEPISGFVTFPEDWVDTRTGELC